MVSLRQVEDQLKNIGSNFKFFGRAEIRELPNILMPDEVIVGCVNGRYAAGFALLVVTNYRLLLIDRRPMFLAFEDIRFDMIAEMDYNAQLIDSAINIVTQTRKLVFKSWNQKALRKILNYTQQQVMHYRQHYLAQQFQPGARTVPRQAASYVGGLAMQGNNNPHQAVMLSPYNRASMPFIASRHRPPKFY